MIETAIVMPVYMVVILGLIFFGYTMLTRQRQAKADAYAAWTPGAEQADRLLGQFWNWNGPVTLNPGNPGASVATAGDTQLNIHGGGPNGELVRTSDDYYGMSINGTVFIPAQLVSGIHQIWGGGTETFDRERVSVSLWNFALGATTQSFDWVPGVGIVQRFNTNYTSFARYLNLTANPAGLMYADGGNPPTALLTGDQGWGGRVSRTLNGSPSGGAWLQRRAVESNATYQPPFFGQVYAEANAPAGDFNSYVRGNYTAPSYRPTSTAQFDVTGRGPGSSRRAAGENGQTANGLLTEVGGFMSLPPLTAPNQLDNRILGSWNGISVTMQQAWTPW